MAGINDLTNIFHHIRVKLYPNYLSKEDKGTFIARTDSDKTVDVKDTCTIMVTRAGFDGSFETLHDYVRQYLKEVAYQLCDGFTVNLEYFTVHPNVGGVFHSANEAHDHKLHPITFRFSPLAKLRALAKNIDVEVVGIADTPAYIDQFVDLEEDMTNSLIVAGHGFAVHGHNIKIDGDDPCGMYFVQVDDPSQKVLVERILENTPSKITAIAPDLDNRVYRVEIVTKYTKGGSSLQSPRTITSPFTIEDI